MKDLNINLAEAERCLNCKIPKCTEGCPINNRIPEFIAEIKNQNFEKAYEIISDVNPLGAICGRVCPHENQCQGSCVRGIKSEPISIGELEASICDWAIENNIKLKYKIKENNIKVAIIGAGPAGIACAVELRKLGYDVTIFEKEEFFGGILMYGIPEYRLPKEMVTKAINNLLELGIKVQLNTKLISNKSKAHLTISTNSNYLTNSTNSTSPNTEHPIKENINLITIDELFAAEYKAIFLGIGSELSNILPIEGAENADVYGANEFLRTHEICKDKKVIVIGGGNVAMDSARVARKEGAIVTVVYRKQKENMPANKDEIEAAEKEGVNFIFGTNIIKITNNKEKLIAECDTNKIIETDKIIMAIGSTPNANYLDERIKLTEQGLIEIDENYQTTLENVFAGGDLVQKKATVCMAIKNGKEAAFIIHKQIT